MRLKNRTFGIVLAHRAPLRAHSPGLDLREKSSPSPGSTTYRFGAATNSCRRIWPPPTSHTSIGTGMIGNLGKDRTTRTFTPFQRQFPHEARGVEHRLQALRQGQLRQPNSIVYSGHTRASGALSVRTEIRVGKTVDAASTNAAKRGVRPPGKDTS